MRTEGIAEEIFRYQLPSDDWFLNKYTEFEEFLDECKKKIEIESYELEINSMLLLNVFARLDERKDYFMYFHSDDETMHMSLGKEIALEAYWLSKYKPIRIKGLEQENEFVKSFRATISDVMAAMLIVAFLIDKDEKWDDYFTVKKIDTLIYDIFNRDISKEAMIMYVESFLLDEERMAEVE